MGPILFVIYINDLPEILDSDCYMFADDTEVFRQIQTTDDSDALQTDLSHLETWSNTWLLRFHPDKCKVLKTGKQHDNNHKYNLCNTTLEHVDKEKDIGVTINNLQTKF
ncbi:uncharacterized protein [Mytilus edulis]|uniref:uncharacterized protein n=1 Tax=Mytilus edulis TaxID=6550 RepID=UPI0039EF2EF7